MHAKLAVADRRVLFDTSANHSQSGVGKNIEAGLLVRGDSAPPNTSAPLASGFRQVLAGTVYISKKVPLTWKNRTFLGTHQPRAEGTFQVKSSARGSRVTVSADGRGLVSQAGAVLLWETLRVTGLGRGLSQGLARWRAPRAVHDPGKVIADLAAAVALGGDCLADIAVLREQPGLTGRWPRTRWCPGWSASWRATCRGRCGRSAPPARRHGSGPGRWPGTRCRALAAGWSRSTWTPRS
jgi:hypothetical protein